ECRMPWSAPEKPTGTCAGSRSLKRAATSRTARSLTGRSRSKSVLRLTNKRRARASVFVVLRGLIEFRDAVSQDCRLECDHEQAREPAENAAHRQPVEDESREQGISDRAHRVFPHVFLRLFEDLLELIFGVTKATLRHIARGSRKLFVHVT